MKVNLNYIKGATLIALVVVIANQVIWIDNMYNLYERDILHLVNSSLERAVYREANSRSEKLGGTLSIFFGTLPDDTTRFIEKKIISKDSIITVKVDRYDPNVNAKMAQTMLKDAMPLDIDKVNALFQQELSNGKYALKESYIDYIDLQTGQVISSNKKDNLPSTFVASNTIVIDIQGVLGVRAYVDSPALAILQRMIFQLALSIILIVIAILLIYYLLRTIYTQRKEERMRQDSINAMTHEFKRPISNAVIHLSLIPHYMERQNEKKVKEYLDNTLLELNKLTAYTERIQRISNNDKEGVSLDKSEIDIVPFFQSIRDKYTKEKDGKNVNVELDISTKEPYLYADLLHFSNVMDNLVENAIKYSKEEVNIQVCVSDISNMLTVSVKDNGLGISSIDQKYIFDKYYRSKNKAARDKIGFGLGLTYVKTIVEAHNGKIEVKSELNKGSEFIVHVPVM